MFDIRVIGGDERGREMGIQFSYCCNFAVSISKSTSNVLTVLKTQKPLQAGGLIIMPISLPLSSPPMTLMST